MDNQIFENLLNNNSFLKDLYYKDEALFISFLYIYYSLNKKQFKRISYYKYSQTIRNLSDSNEALNESNILLLKTNYHQVLFNRAYEYLSRFSSFDIKVLIQDLIVKFIEKNFDTVNDLGSLDENLLPFELGSILVMTNKVKKFLLKRLDTINRFYFNFYDSKINCIYAIFFDLININYHILSFNKSELNNIYFDNIYFVAPFMNSELMSKIRYSFKSFNNLSVDSILSTFLLDHLKKDGRMVSFLTTGTLSNTRDYKLRKTLIDNKRINLVIELPKVTNLPIPLSLVFITESNAKINVTNATKYANRLNKNIDSEKIVRAATGEIEGALIEMDYGYIINNNYDITPHRYTDRKNYEFINPVPLKDVTKLIYRGFQIPSDMIDEYESTFPTKIKLLTLTDIDNGEVIKNKLTSLKDIDKKMKHYILKNNDLVISCKGKTFKTCVLDIPSDETYISTGSLIVIRVDEEKIDPTYLKIFLDSKIGIDALKNIQTGTNVLSLNPTKLQDIKVPLVDLEKQYVITSSYRYKNQNIKEVEEVIKEMKKEVTKKFDNNFLELLK